jgi:hypothetical protein
MQINYIIFLCYKGIPIELIIGIQFKIDIILILWEIEKVFIRLLDQYTIFIDIHSLRI